MDHSSFELPPILPDLDDELKNYLINPEKLSIHLYERNQEFWSRTPNPKELLHFERSPLSTTLKVKRDLDTGDIIDFCEVPLKAAGATAKNSMSFNRAPALPSEATRGNPSFKPFWPASFSEPVLELPKVNKSILDDTTLLTIPPGFSRGLTFDTNGKTILNEVDENTTPNKINNTHTKVNLLDIVHEEQELLGIWHDNVKKDEIKEVFDNKLNETLPEEMEVLPKEVSSILNISSLPPPNKLQGTEWVVLLDTTKPVKDFDEQIPEKAYKFEFELDTFQKLAIIQLEKHNHIFVAAHTSAGKTVVAEYAIALSQKHMTRTIYTSPIKALSNQKYRDFRKSFKDVGLLTGDFQINTTASCVIMTTEILRSMLYCGSDITRDLEYVIFDEVHYINDRERGHVWEQVLILLPSHVCVVLLSATVPNTIEFADWLGRTHKKKVYVVTTSQRPVPLNHFLYTGTSGRSKDNRFLVQHRDKWIINGYNKAVASVTDVKSNQNPFNNPIFGPKQEKQLWNCLLDHLKRQDLLPVVAFTFSRAKCDSNAENLINSVDLTNEKEKFKIRTFFYKHIKRLKEDDHNIPQIIRMRQILERGIGVHHSGILPIIKEMVEMLFQDGYIKLLFATETFAMGVNMPARTVVFDSITKHDGQERRNLKPAEYIQMAGRAGRRGLDREGTVIILCKHKVPDIQELQKMMLGIPSLLKSQFRLTYGMVLSLLRVESISVEGMMSRSFCEAEHQKKMIELQIELENVQKKLDNVCSEELSNYLQPLIKFYETTREFLKYRELIMNKIITSPKMAKIITPGRIILITHKSHINKLAILLSIIKGKSPQYKVLVLTDSMSKIIDEEKDDFWYKMISLADCNIFIPTNSLGHEVLIISPIDIFEITNKIIKIDTELIEKDWDKRQIERFKMDPPGQTCQNGIKELHKLTKSFENKIDHISYLHLIHDLKLNEQYLFDEINNLYILKDKIIDHIFSTHIPNFDGHFYSVFKRKYLEDQKENLEYLLSSASLTLYPDYECRIELLRRLGYVNNENQVELKGRVACEMGMNELLITELVLRNILTKLKSEEVAAVLSLLVCPQKKYDSQDDLSHLGVNLSNALKEVASIHDEIANMENSLQIKTDEFQKELNYSLVEVVYEWASAKSFAEIMNLTDFQEGIIVRCIQQLNDTICDVKNAARIIGDPELQSKMEEASTAIKRDIVFVDSLYTYE